MSARTLRRAFDRLDAGRLRPVVDAEMATVKADCPACSAQDTDPLEMHRPLSVSCHTDPPRVWCATGCSDAAITTALEAGPTDWRAVAHELLDVARGLVVLLDAATDVGAGAGADADDIVVAA